MNAVHPPGTYGFNVQNAASNWNVSVNFPNTMQQPDAPHVSNYNAAQVANPSQPFMLTWDAFAGGTSNDFIGVQIGSAFISGNPGEPGALDGTATSVTIPAGALQGNQIHTGGSIRFFRYAFTTDGNNCITFVYRATITDFTLATASPTGQLRLTNTACSSGIFSFDVLCSTGQTVTVEYRTNLAAGTWQSLLTTNSSGSRFHAVSPQTATNSVLFFRARNGP